MHVHVFIINTPTDAVYYRYNRIKSVYDPAAPGRLLGPAMFANWLVLRHRPPVVVKFVYPL